MQRLPRRNQILLLIVLFAGLIAPAAFSATQLIRVPADQPTLQSAISAVNEGGIIEMAAGIYPAPNGAFTIYDTGKGFTIRAATGASVTLSGGGTTDVIRFGNASLAAGRPVTFQGLTFSNAVSTTDFIGGAFTLTHAEAIFIGCSFQNNAANPPASGGGVFWLQDAVVSFEQCTFNNNSSRNYGGALAVVESRIFLSGCSFVSNRVNLPSHSPSSIGGAIFNSNSSIRADSCRFQDNQASYVGGAIYCGGAWKDPVSQPSAEVLVSNSLFSGNFTERDPAVPNNAAPIGGAIHMEDQATGKFVNCRFENNHAVQAGAISNYRSITEVTGCIFKGNYVSGTSPGESIGGSIFVMSSDGNDPSTNFGTINRRSSSLTVTDSLFQGQADGSSSALEGGAIFVSGDLNAAFGNGGVTQNGTEASNRANLTITRSIFADFKTDAIGSIPGSAGAIAGAFVTMRMDSSIVENCNTSGNGGALQFVQRSFATITNSTISRCRAGSLGGAIAAFASDLRVTGTNFVQNQITGGGNGAAVVTGPVSAGNGVPIGTDATGLLQNCVFAGNTGGTSIYDSDGFGSGNPVSKIQYSANQFFPGDKTTYFDDITGPKTVAELNALTILRSDGSTTTKTPAANVALTLSPVLGQLLMVPRTVLQRGAPGETLPIPSYLGFASNGGATSLDGARQPFSAGTAPTTTDGVHTLNVDSSTFSTTPPPSVAVNISTRLPVGAGDNALIGGFIIVGPTPKRVMIRAVGPSIGIPGTLQDPTLELHDPTGAVIASNDNWRSTQIGGLIASDQVIDLHASSIAPTNDAEAAMIVTLAPGIPFTAVVRGANNGTGIALIEVYDLDAGPTSTLANISTRGAIQTGDNVMIAGTYILGGTGITNVVVRGIGPSLKASNIPTALDDPTLELHDSNGRTVMTNDDWAQSPRAAELIAAGLQPSSSAESAMFLSGLALGPYTAILQGKGGGIGVGLVEVYVFQ